MVVCTNKFDGNEYTTIASRFDGHVDAAVWCGDHCLI